MHKFEEAVIKLIPRMRRYAFLFTGERGAADELVEAALKEAVVRKRELKEGIRLQPWLLTILHRPLAAWSSQSELQPIVEPAKNGKIRRGIQGFRPEASQTSTLEGALGALSFAERSILLLVVVEELTVEDAASVMNLKVDVARWTLQEARSTLLEALSLFNPSPADDREGELVGGLKPQDEAPEDGVLSRH